MGDVELELGRLGCAVVARDATTVVLDKPAGVASEMRVDTDGRSLLGRVQRAGWPEARLPHRLDKVTAGLLVVARDATAVERHNAALRDDRWAKRYVAVVEPGDDPGTLLGTHRRYLRREGRAARVVRSGGRPAWQDHELVVPDPGTGAWWVVVRLRTGRYHQVRAVLADMGHPLVGDERYGGRTAGGAGGLRTLMHARVDGVELDGVPTTLLAAGVDAERAAWPAPVVTHLLRTDLA